jgi:TPR repeat protein
MSAEQGNALGQYNLANMYGNGYGVTKDHNEELKWHQKSADQGNKLSQFYLDYMYQNGYGVT